MLQRESLKFGSSWPGIHYLSNEFLKPITNREEELDLDLSLFFRKLSGQHWGTCSL